MRSATGGALRTMIEEETAFIQKCLITAERQRNPSDKCLFLGLARETMMHQIEHINALVSLNSREIIKRENIAGNAFSSWWHKQVAQSRKEENNGLEEKRKNVLKELNEVNAQIGILQQNHKKRC